jgi:eukaryotic-like serine/threonine-protein kinase
LQDLPFRLLAMLVERPGEIVTREEVRQRLWPENTFVEFDNSLGVAIRKIRESLNDNAEAPHYVATVPRRGYRFIAPVSLEEPVAELKQAAIAEPIIESFPGLLPVASTVPDQARMQPAQPHWGAWAAAGVALLLGVGAASFRFHTYPPYVSPKSEVNAAAEVRLRRSVAVLGFRNLPGRAEDDWLSPVFSEMLDTELGTRGDLRMISEEDVARIQRELPRAEGDTLSKTTLDHLRNNPGADVVVLGSYIPLPGKDEKRIRLDLRVQDTADGETIAEEAITGDRDNLFDLAARAGARLRQRLGLSPNSSGDTSAARLALPADQTSARLYVEGREKLWAFDFLGARELLLKAVAADPQFPLAHSALSEAWWHLGYANKARVEAQRARELAVDLAPEDRLLIEGQYFRAISDYPQAVQSYLELFHRFPDSLDYGLLLATAQMYVQPSAALKTLANLRRFPAPMGEDARIDMTEASAWIGRDLVKARAAARTAIEKGRAQGKPQLVARTYGFLCQQGTGIGLSMQEAISDCESAMNGDAASGNRNGAAMMMTDLAGIYFLQGDIARSEEMFGKAINEFREVGNTDGIAASMNNLGAARLSEGNLPEARKLLEEAIPNYEAIEDKQGVALSLSDLGELYRQNGKLTLAEANYQKARTAAEEIDDKSAIAYVMNGLGSLLADRGELAAARTAYERSLALRTEVGEKQNEGETRIAMAVLSLDDGKKSDGDAELRALKDQFHRERQADDELAASVAITNALLAQGKQQAAQLEVDASRGLAGKSQNLASRLEYELVTARMLMSSEHPETAGPVLDQVLKAARGRGLVNIELEGMLVAANLQKRLGRTEAAHGQLVALEHTAKEQGFGLIARKAAAARG